MVRSVPTATEQSEVRERWGEQLRLARVARQDTQHEAGAAVGLHGPTVSRAEQGRGSIEIYERLARHYSVILTLGGDQ